MQTAWVQLESKSLANLFFEKAVYGLQKRGWLIRRFKSPMEVRLQEGDILYGGAKEVRAIVKLDPIDYPPELHEYLVSTPRARLWKEIPPYVRDLGPIFVKPQYHKLFAGTCLRSEADLAKLFLIPPEIPVWTMECTEFLSEWRIFVGRGEKTGRREVLGVTHYQGDPLIGLPDRDFIQDMIDAWTLDAPHAYSLDVGLTSGGYRLVEVNDVPSLGCEGISPYVFAKMLEERWQYYWLKESFERALEKR